jgi:hypothetical protein
MNKKYERYIDYIVNDLEIPYFFNMKNQYGLRPDEYELVLSKVFKGPVTIKGNNVYDINGNTIYSEYSDGYWTKKEYDDNGKIIYQEFSNGSWVKREYDSNGNKIYYEDSIGVIEDNR